MEADTASSQQVVAVLKMKTEREKGVEICDPLWSFKSSLFARSENGTGPPTSKSVQCAQTHAVGDGRVALWIDTVVAEKSHSPIFLNGSTFLQTDIAS